MPYIQYILDRRDCSTSSISCISCIFCSFETLTSWGSLGFSTGQGLKIKVDLKWKNTKMYLIVLGLLVCILDIFCIFCMFCIFCIFFCKYANLTYYIFGIMCIFVILMTQSDGLRWRRQQHKLSWSDDFQYSWWRSSYLQVSKQGEAESLSLQARGNLARGGLDYVPNMEIALLLAG